VENHKKWIEWINLESGGLEYKGRIYKKEVLNHEVQLMMRIINTMDYNQLAHEPEIRDANNRKERREAAKVLVDMSRGGEERNNGGITTSNNGEDNNGNRNPAAKPMFVDNGGKEGVEETCTALNDVVIKEGGAEAVADRGRADNNFEGDGKDLGQGKEETTLTDGAKDPGGNAGADGVLVDGMDEVGEETTLTDCAMSTGGDKGADKGPVNDMDEIGLIFDFEDIKTKVCLKEFGSYVKFNNKCLHRGYKSGSVNTYLSNQLFSAPMGKRCTVQNNVAKFEERILNEDSLSVPKSISEAVQKRLEGEIHEEEIQSS
jgi:hypothetical protein